MKPNKGKNMKTILVILSLLTLSSLAESNRSYTCYDSEKSQILKMDLGLTIPKVTEFYREHEAGFKLSGTTTASDIFEAGQSYRVSHINSLDGDHKIIIALNKKDLGTDLIKGFYFESSTELEAELACHLDTI